ncbi:Thaumatin-like protein [Hibiscus syriacus]|uniref:Thaumatin-like protein n=1 Tax=Hibiscus syriacus TaxID=106335 RepID=A0A6A3CBK3_HIBSY|nr:Thaumatin-like protein [Hibiscus syriacus]
MNLPPLWSGRFWGRHGCSFDATGRGRFATGDCGGSLYCKGLGGTAPATLAEITLGTQQDFYDVSLVDEYNIAMSITPSRGTGKCSYAGCVSDLNLMCPVALQVRGRDNKRVVACFAFNSPRYCCTGIFGSPQSCKPTVYSRIFKTACPKGYSYAYDDPKLLSGQLFGHFLPSPSLELYLVVIIYICFVYCSAVDLLSYREVKIFGFDLHSLIRA